MPPANFDLRGRQGFVERQIRGLASKATWASLMLVTVVVAAGYYFRQQVGIFVRGPKVVTVDELVAGHKELRETSPWVRVTGLDLEQVMSRQKSRSGRIDSTLNVHPVGDGTTASLFVILGSGGQPKEVTGWITDMPSVYSSHTLRIFGRAARGVPTLEARGEELYIVPGLVAFAALGLLGVAGYQWLRGRRLLNPQRSKPLINLLRFGPLMESLPVINTDLGSGSVQKFGPVTVGTDHIALVGQGILEVFRISQTVWTYPEITQHRYNGIPTGKSYRIVLCDIHGYKAAVSLSKKRVEKLIEIIKLRQPNALTNYTDELGAYWDANPKATAEAIKNREKTG